MTAVVDCSIVIRVLANRAGDDVLRQRLARTLHAPALIDAEISSVIRGLTVTTKPNVRIASERARQLLDDYAGLRIVRYPMQPLQQRVFALRHNLTAYDAMYVALAEALDVSLLTDDAKLAGASGHHAVIESYPQ